MQLEEQHATLSGAPASCALEEDGQESLGHYQRRIMCLAHRSLTMIQVAGIFLRL